MLGPGGLGSVQVGRSTMAGWVGAGDQCHWHIRIDQALRDKIRPEVPDGWLPLDQAAEALDVARQTVLNKAQRGELQAVHVNQGRRKGLRIQVKREQDGLFDTP